MKRPCYGDDMNVPQGGMLFAGTPFQLGIAALIPDEYAAYRPLLAEALSFFVSELPAHRIARMMDGQKSLPASAGPAQRLVAVMHHCPTLHKLGQVLARDRRLTPELRRRLQRLESLEPRTPVAAVRRIIDTELSNSHEDTIQRIGEPLAEASVAVVVPFEWREAGSTRIQRGVFKVLKPGIEAQLHEELEAWSKTGAFLDERSDAFGFPAVEFQDTIKTVRDLLVHEVQLEREQANLLVAAETYRTVRGVRVPELLPFSTPRMTAMERLDGPKVTEAHNLTPVKRRALAETIVNAIIARPLWSPVPESIFHADPHAGNLRVTDEGELVLLDWSLAGRLGKQERERVTALIVAAMTCDAARAARSIESLATASLNQSRLRTVVESALHRLRGAIMPGLDWLTGLLDDAVTGAGARFSADLLLFRKTLHVLGGVVEDVSEDASADDCLRAEFATRLAREWPARAFATPFARYFPTHLSNADLLTLLWAGPATIARAWMNVASPPDE